MIDIATALQILALIPPLQFGTPAPVAPVERYGTLFIAACDVGESVTAAGVSTQADNKGVARLVVPAQAPDAESYLVTTIRGDTRMNGTLRAGELLVGACP